MTLLALLAAALLWYQFGRKAVRDKQLWPALAMAVIGLVLLAKGMPVVGIALVGGAIALFKWPKRRRARATIAPQAFETRMAQAEARQLLGVPPHADRSAIIAAHRKLIARNHPDSGGSAGLAAQLNAARDMLLRESE